MGTVHYKISSLILGKFFLQKEKIVLLNYKISLKMFEIIYFYKGLVILTLLRNFDVRITVHSDPESQRHVSVTTSNHYYSVYHKFIPFIKL